VSKLRRTDKAACSAVIALQLYFYQHAFVAMILS